MDATKRALPTGKWHLPMGAVGSLLDFSPREIIVTREQYGRTRFTQTFAVKPHTVYMVRAKVRTENVTPVHDNGGGKGVMMLLGQFTRDMDPYSITNTFGSKTDPRSYSDWVDSGEWTEIYAYRDSGDCDSMFVALDFGAASAACAGSARIRIPELVRRSDAGHHRGGGVSRVPSGVLPDPQDHRPAHLPRRSRGRVTAGGTAGKTTCL